MSDILYSFTVWDRKYILVNQTVGKIPEKYSICLIFYTVLQCGIENIF
jgi:hypothetical protein